MNNTTTNTKSCAKCGETKSIESFSNNRNNPDGKQYYCKECMGKQMKQYHIPKFEINDHLRAELQKLEDKFSSDLISKLENECDKTKKDRIIRLNAVKLSAAKLEITKKIRAEYAKSIIAERKNAKRLDRIAKRKAKKDTKIKQQLQNSIDMLTLRLQDGEEIKQIPENPKYYATTHGRVWSTIQNKFLVQSDHRSGYKFIGRFTINGVKKLRLIHAIIAHTFIPNPNKLPEINHINMDKHDNRVCNLEWTTREDNIKHATLNGAYDTNKTPIEVFDKYGEFVGRFDSMTEAATVIGVCRETISKTLSGKASCKKYIFQYAV